MPSRSYRGRMAYLTHGVGETGREAFHVSVHEDGSRTLRAVCEMDDFDLLRDVSLTVNAHWRPVDAYVRLRVDGAFSGAAWYRFDGNEAHCHGLTADGSAFSDRQRLEKPIQSMGTHALHNDAWLLARIRNCDGDLDSLLGVSFTTSLTPNGGTGPALVPVPRGTLRIHDLGRESIDVPAGNFTAHHARVEVSEVDSFDVWAAGEDCVPVLLTSDGLHQRYELLELSGDYL